MVPVGSHLGRYKILAPLGSGGMGEVYRAHDERLGRDVAIKVLSERLADDRTALGRFEREAKALATLSHAHILTVHEFHQEEGVTFLVMELLEGETLRGRLERAALPWPKALEIGVAIADGLAAAHSRGVVHRDLKPENVFLTSGGGIKILDFGLAHLGHRPATPEQGPMEPTLGPDTHPGTVMGTVPYMAPEQVLGLPMDARTDIFAFGCILYEMLTGHSPFDRASVGETRASILRDEPVEPTASGKKIPFELERVVLHCLEKKAEDRFQSARDLAFDLRAILTGSGLSKLTAPPPRRPRRAVWAAAGLGLAALLVAAAYILFGRGKQAEPGGPIESVAVLPFRNVGAAANTEYLSDGITESIINNLAQVPNLKVMSRNSVFRYKGKDPDVQEVGRELDVQAVVTGRLMIQGDNLSVSVELVDARDSRQLWGERYNRKLADLFTIQDEIAREITAKLRLRLSGEDRKRLAKHHTADIEAYQLYLRGRFALNQRTREGMQKAVKYFEAARAKDPAYALAYAGLADSYALLGDWNYLPPTEAFPKAKAAALKALERDDALAEAYTSLAFVKAQYDWDWAGAEKDFKHALQLNPNYATAHQWYSEFLTAMGRHGEALAEIKRAQELDPLSPIISAVRGRALYFARRYDPAGEQCRKVVEADPKFSAAHLFLGRIYVQQKKYEEAVAEFKEARKLANSTATLAELGHAYAAWGKKAEARKILDELEKLAKKSYVSPARLALIHIGLGDKAKAFPLLERAFTERSDAMPFLKVEPRFDGLHSDPRFAALVKRVGLGP
jgi:serine/threonine-protein kinase